MKQNPNSFLLDLKQQEKKPKTREWSEIVFVLSYAHNVVPCVLISVNECSIPKETH